MLVWSVASSLAAAVLATEAAGVLGAESAPGPSVVAVPMAAAATAAEAAETEFKAVLGLCGYRLADAAWMATTCSEKRLAADLLAGKAEAEATAAQGRGARSALRVFADTVAEVEAETVCRLGAPPVLVAKPSALAGARAADRGAREEPREIEPNEARASMLVGPEGSAEAESADCTCESVLAKSDEVSCSYKTDCLRLRAPMTRRGCGSSPL